VRRWAGAPSSLAKTNSIGRDPDAGRASRSRVPQSARRCLATSPAATLSSTTISPCRGRYCRALMAEERLTSRPVASLRALPHRQDTVAQVCRVRHAHVAEPRILRPMPRTEESTAALPGVTRDSSRAKKMRAKGGAELTETIDGEHMQTRSAQPRRHPALAMKAACYVGRRPGQFHQRVRQAPVLQRLRPSAETPILRAPP
jgi:hypothetical protein